MKKSDIKLPELLCPAGSAEALRAAIDAGADAVYFGGTMFNARMNAKNFGRDELIDAISLCHEKGVRAYITFNTQIYDREMKSALDYAGFLYGAGADALIIADLGLASLIKKYLPSFPLHASTQMSIHNLMGVDRLYSEGFERVVIARELSRENISAICKNAKAETELFVHGAICASCSGQCLMSAMLGGRSGNRGECAQPCRMSYNGEYPISIKDMCLADHIPEIIGMGVSSLKIEGRMKSPDYVYGVGKIYRSLLDENRGATESEKNELARLFSRGGFTDGYYTSKIDRGMLGVRSDRDISDTRAMRVYKEGRRAEKREEIKICRVNPTLPEKPESFKPRTAQKAIYTARFSSASQIPDSHPFDIVYLPLSKFDGRVANGVILPTLIYDSELEGVKQKLSLAVSRGAHHVMITNISQLSLIKELPLVPHGDFRLNVFNSHSADYAVRSNGLESLILSCELTLPQIRDINLPSGVRKGAVIYGRYPLMLLEKSVGKPRLHDRKGADFPVIREEGRDVVYNSVPVYMADQTDRLDKVGIEERHMIFSDENRGEVMKIIYAYAHSIIPKESIRRLK